MNRDDKDALLGVLFMAMIIGTVILISYWLTH